MVKYSDELIEEIRSNNDIVDVISQYVILKRSGRNFFGLCPFHREKSPSFSVSPDKQIFHCFGCGAGGNVIHFIQKIEGLNFRESLEVLAEKSGIQLPVLDSSNDTKQQELKTKVYEINKLAAEFYHETLYKPTSKQAQEYVKLRKLGNNTIKSFSIGYSPSNNELYKFLKENGYSDEEILASSLVNKMASGEIIDRFKKRLMFPISDIRGRVIAFGGRILDDTKPKYINSPENIVYSKGRHLYGLNVAKKGDTQKLIVVEGYMDAVSLYQRGITNVVASLGTALTEAQGRLLRKSCEQVVIGYDSDEAGQVATLRGLEILKNLGCDLRILQIQDAKDPDEFVIKYGSERFNKLVEKSISLIEYKVKLLKNDLKIETTNDKIKFLTEIAKILSEIETKIELEVYIDRIAEEYKISKEAIYAEINKLKYEKSQGSKILEKKTPVSNIKKKTDDKISDVVLKREELVIALLLIGEEHIYTKLKENITIKDIKSEINRKIINKLYEEYEKGNINISNILDIFGSEEEISHITQIMSQDFEITEIDKCLSKLINTYIREKLQEQKEQIIKKMSDENCTKEEAANLEIELNNIIMKLAKIK